MNRELLENEGWLRGGQNSLSGSSSVPDLTSTGTPDVLKYNTWS